MNIIQSQADYKQSQLKAFKTKLASTGNVFDFMVYDVSHQFEVTQDHHIEALIHFFDELKYNHEAHKAVCTELDSKKIVKVTNATLTLQAISWYEQLIHAFYHPPYGLQSSDIEIIKDLFTHLGLLPNQPVQVLDWVGNFEKEPHRSYWCDYFDDGKEWWGIWCMTIFNQRNQTLAVLMASSTD